MPSLTCAPVIPPAFVLTFGASELRDSSTTPVTLRRVTLAQPHQIQLIAAWVVPITSTDTYGVRSGYPPAPPIPPGWSWSQREPAKGALITHNWNLILIIKPTHHEGWANGINVDYTASGTTYSMLIPSKLVTITGTTCPKELPLHL